MTTESLVVATLLLFVRRSFASSRRSYFACPKSSSMAIQAAVDLGGAHLSGLRLPSVRSLLGFVGHLQIRLLELDSVVFPEGSPPVPRHDVPRPRPSLRTLRYDHGHTFFDCTRTLTSFPFRVRLSNIILCSQRCPPLDECTEQLVAKYLQLFAVLHPSQGVIPRLQTYAYSLHQTRTGSESVTVRIRKLHAYVGTDTLTLTCPDVDVDTPTTTSSLLAHPEPALAAIAATCPNPPVLHLKCTTAATCRALVHALLDSRAPTPAQLRPGTAFVQVAAPYGLFALKEIVDATTTTAVAVAVAAVVAAAMVATVAKGS
ncbi:uncharacterized protein PHACADRAFT_198933 [Phanerochaete carnosa HHB-10118-sp]|uniref:Secreted protein n=1 Tax=Phanerochaete carnosa (strain HHB-10118-sp) TaxID=650164 RepID=K5W1Y0_PHACS|nr:uncharacterized protein PHACADRAFT_198933 [Phanerochaete carnosa HHB-10118-sp]EKM52884.1 hypothetical protein PHACADRAFT_198933 [Phanerochaete carnosa HHB-10118-sp]